MEATGAQPSPRPCRQAWSSPPATSRRVARSRRGFGQAERLEAIGQLAGGVAHDFNNVLLVIRGYSSVLRVDRSTDPQHIADVDEIANAADRAAELTRQLLAFGRRQVLAAAPARASSKSSAACRSCCGASMPRGHRGHSSRSTDGVAPVVADPGADRSR